MDSANPPKAILITQCLQNDFVKPISRFDPLPNRLHVGYEEARRLMGEKPSEGALSLTMQWAYQQHPDELMILHIRDWHDPEDAFQNDHFRQFGAHCIQNTPGAEFAFPIAHPDRKVVVISSPGLNDFLGTGLAEALSPFADLPVRIGLVGVWTEAKVSFLAYDLRTRFPRAEIAVCSALTAGSSRAHHFMALEQMRRLLGVALYPSVGEFARFLGTGTVAIPLPLPSHADCPSIEFEGKAPVSETDRDLIRYLFRDCQKAHIRVLDGGFSGNLVLGSEGVDLHGHRQAQHVVKIGPQGPIGQERAAFEQVEGVLGNSAPRIADFADLGGRGALKYRYAAMGGGFSTTFQKLYMAGLPQEKTVRYLREVLVDQLGRFYDAATLERCNLLEYYGFDPRWAPSVRAKVENILGAPATGSTIRLPLSREVANLCLFYERELSSLLPLAQGSAYFSYVHGDLNGANIIVDAHDNVWIIDFFHTHRGHVLKDLIKLENDLLYIFTPLTGEEDLRQAFELTDLLLSVENLGSPLSETEADRFTSSHVRRAYETICFLRSLYPPLIQASRDPLQVFIGQLRYAAHTLSFDESNALQKVWALYTSCQAAARISDRLRSYGPLRVDWLDAQYTTPGHVGLTILPGRKDFGRSLQEDVASLKEQGVSHVLCLLGEDELLAYGVPDLIRAYGQAGLLVKVCPMLDHGVCSKEEMTGVLQWIEQALAQKSRVVVHCLGGLGRSGLVAACVLTARGLNPDQALIEVRRARSPRAVETEIQERFIREFP